MNIPFTIKGKENDMEGYCRYIQSIANIDNTSIPYSDIYCTINIAMNIFNTMISYNYLQELLKSDKMFSVINIVAFESVDVYGNPEEWTKITIPVNNSSLNNINDLIVDYIISNNAIEQFKASDNGFRIAFTTANTVVLFPKRIIWEALHDTCPLYRFIHIIVHEFIHMDDICYLLNNNLSISHLPTGTNIDHDNEKYVDERAYVITNKIYYNVLEEIKKLNINLFPNILI